MGCCNTIHLEAGPVPCGKCFECRLTRQRMLTVRIVCEAQCHKDSYFLTATYDEQHLPESVEQAKLDLQAFLKKIHRHTGVKPRVFSIIERGERTERLHHHIMLFGVEIQDEMTLDSRRSFDDLLNNIKSPPRSWYSPMLSKFWGRGGVQVGRCEVGSAEYMANYCQKPVGAAGGAVCRAYFPRNPPLGGSWMIKYYDDIVNSGRVVLPGGIIMPVPKQFLTDKFLYPEELDIVRKKKAEYSKKKYEGVSREELLRNSIAKQALHESRREAHKKRSI